MFDIYKKTDLLVEDLKKANYEKYGESIRDAKLSGSVTTEILGLILEELKRHNQVIKKEDTSLAERARKIEAEIRKVLNLD